jgi:hypothetical protein
MADSTSIPTSILISSSQKKRRRAITDAEKKAIREHWAELPAGHKQKSHKAVID